MIVKDFELIGLCKVLEIDYEELKNTIEQKIYKARFLKVVLKIYPINQI